MTKTISRLYNNYSDARAAVNSNSKRPASAMATSAFSSATLTGPTTIRPNLFLTVISTARMIVRKARRQVAVWVPLRAARWVYLPDWA